MKQRFGQQNVQEKFVQELRALKREKGESISVLDSKFRVIMTRAFGPKWQTTDHGQFNAVEHFLKALNDPDLELRIRDRDPVTLDDAVKLAIRLESNTKVNKPMSPAHSSIKRTSAGKSDLKGTHYDLKSDSDDNKASTTKRPGRKSRKNKSASAPASQQPVTKTQTQDHDPVKKS